ncbi:MAG TPA: choice-of-anchor tandem repeat GloVer-containing protein, partial [Bacteroidia bacterium]|nr:choice-of-anchor tandem repeat GloVer-containing protein [Bacteroidia bacterium]
MKKYLLQGILFFILGNSAIGQVTLFAACYGGGAHHRGSVFQLCETSGSWTYRDLYDFRRTTATSSSEAQGTLFLASNNVLYGISDNGGASFEGMIYSENPVTGTYTDFYSVNNSPYLNYFMQPVRGGKLYGLGNRGGASNYGNVFAWNYNTNTYSDLHDFAGEPNDGRSPIQSTLCWYRDTLYGITAAGGNILGSCGNGYGTLFSLDTNGVRYRVLYNFANGCSGGANTGSDPEGSIVEAAGPSGHPCIYGICYAFGANGAYLGCIWQYDLSTYTYSDIHDFTGSTSGDGAEPSGGLILATDGNLYGTCSAGGNSNGNGGFSTYSTGYGTLFKINPSTHAFSVVHTFQAGATDGEFASGSVIQGPDGNL